MKVNQKKLPEKFIFARDHVLKKAPVATIYSGIRRYFVKH